LLFPEDRLLEEMGVASYIGAPVLTKEGSLSGILILLDDGTIENVDFYNAIIEFLSIRVAAELDRIYIEKELKRQVIEKTAELERANQELRSALAEIKTLRGIIPICSNCKKIRDYHGFWQQVDTYISEHTQALFSHGVCPECVDKLYGDVDLSK
jgi:hypothetical protein